MYPHLFFPNKKYKKKIQNLLLSEKDPSEMSKNITCSYVETGREQVLDQGYPHDIFCDQKRAQFAIVAESCSG